MGRPKGRKNRQWTKDERLRIVKQILEEHLTWDYVANTENLSLSMLKRWIDAYEDFGEDGLELKSGNRFSALHTSKSLSEEERLKLIIMQQEIEIERLKKGYIVKGVGASKEYVTLRKKSMK